MYIDKLLELEPGLVAVTANANSTNVIDLGTDRDVGNGKPLYLVIIIKAIDAGNGDEIYSFNLNTDDNAGMASANTLLTIPVGRTSLVGSMFITTVPNTNERFLLVRAQLSGTTPSITYQAFLTSEEPSVIRHFPNAI